MQKRRQKVRGIISNRIAKRDFTEKGNLRKDVKGVKRIQQVFKEKHSRPSSTLLRRTHTRYFVKRGKTSVWQKHSDWGGGGGRRSQRIRRSQGVWSLMNSIKLIVRTFSFTLREMGRCKMECRSKVKRCKS